MKDIENVAKKNGQFFGFDFLEKDSDIVLMPIPCNLTCSFRDNTINAPKKMIDISGQLDFFNIQSPKKKIYKCYTSLDILSEIASLSLENRPIVKTIINNMENGGENDEYIKKYIPIINQISKKINKLIFEKCLDYINKHKKVVLIGGDHSVSYGLIKALSQDYSGFSLLQIDAHADLREAYMGFEFSHASAMNNALKMNAVNTLTQVGVRDICKSEYNKIMINPRINSFFDYEISQLLFQGKTWDYICNLIIEKLEDNVYLSFDIDGLSPENCPSTGTPVPGGLTYKQAVYLIEKIKQSGKNIIGADLCEIAYDNNNEIDCIIGSHLLWKLIACL